ncbi:EAL domain-containing protein [Alteromonas sp. 5E99-2]|uniref:EAL and HDOD domain-containing protein n=1 Tax=Alteromonas sp. 5E99-2 TaxID=2817683 RepID=UPI001A9990BC|nr:EAL domain-containing protein [Alteromonas sp. 5E99-2]MBO1256956.1 EAL domain-containing protein [Alteromonas sp. 5E99-2]
MFAFIAREPILDHNKNVFAYELIFRDGKGGALPEKASPSKQKLSEKFNGLGLDDICAEKTSFITIDPQMLEECLPPLLQPESVIVEFDASKDDENVISDACHKIKSLGFKVALSNLNVNTKTEILLESADIVKINISQVDISELKTHIALLSKFNIQLIAEHVATYNDFNACKEMGFDLFQGYFFAQPEQRIQRNLPASKLNLIDLMGESSKSSFDIERINNIVERDAALSFLLLKFINNPTINKRYQISSLKHALNFMGEVEIKKFIALLSLANLSDDKAIELIHMSLVRAKFFDLLSQRRKLDQNPPYGFLIGLFSLLESLLDQSMSDVLQQLPLVDKVKKALLGENEEFSSYLSLVKAFESAVWLTVIQQSRVLDIDQKELHGIYNQSIVWGNGVRQSISAYFPSRAVD